MKTAKTVQLAVAAKNLLVLLVAGMLCAACLALAGCGSADDESGSADDSAVSAELEEAAGDYDPVGEYHFDSISLENEEGISGAGLGGEWDGAVLDADYATLSVNEDGTVVVTGALEATGAWLLAEESGTPEILSLDGVDFCGYSADAGGNLSIDVNTEDGVITYAFCK